MNNKKNVPDIRFKGFNFGWKSKRFDKTFSMLSNNTLSRADLNYEKGSTKNVHYGDILIRFGECTNVARENIPYISDDKVADKYISSRLQDGDIVFADTAEDATAGKCSEFFNIQEQPIISGLHTIPCHPLLPFSIGYLGYFLNSPSYHNQLLPLMQGTKVVGISKTAIKETNISFPEDVDEQQAIGNYFQNIDRLINTSQTKLDKLKNIKKACLEKMFPRNGSTTPELRFKGFTEEWKGGTLGSATYIYDGTHQTPNYTDCGIMFLSVENIRTLKSNKYISEEDFKRDFKIYPELGDVLMTRIGNIGTANTINTNELIAFYVSLALLKKKDLDPYFLKESIHSEEVRKGLWHRTLHIAFPQKINKNEIEKVVIKYPNTQEEQIKIGYFFKNIDDLIVKTEQQINKLKNIKKACLDKMFVNE